VLVLASSTSLASSAHAQDSCVAGNLGRNDVLSSTVPGLGRITYVSGAHFVCDGGSQIWADSAVVYDSRSMSEFIGSFRYVDGDRELLADDARYFFDLGRLQAEGNVSLRDEAAGSSIRRGDLVLMLANDLRDEESMTVTTGADGLRPIAVLAPPTDSTALAADSLLAEPREPETPYTITGDRIDLRGGSSFTSSGTVEIVRDSLVAFADSVEYDSSLGGLVLSGSARVVGEGYDLVGRTITMDSPAGAARTLRSQRHAVLTGDDLLLTSAQIIVFMKDDALERLVAIPIARGGAGATLDSAVDSADFELPRATVDDFLLTADSLEVWAPGESIERVFAAGSARSASTSRDTLNVRSLPEVARTDWLEGDTVIVTFRSPGRPTTDLEGLVNHPDSVGWVAPADSGGLSPADSVTLAPPPVPVTAQVSPADGAERPKREVEAIVAKGKARSLYRLIPSDTTARIGVDPPAVHYVVGDEIRIEMEEGEVRGMQVKGQTRGVHLEPLRRAVPPPAQDSLATDTLGIVSPRASTGRADRSDQTSATPGRPQAPAEPDTTTVPLWVVDTLREEKFWTPR